MADQKQPSTSNTVKNIVLVGRTGNGKSATGNSLIGKQVFISERKSTGVTMTCQTYTTVAPNGSRINVIDTPGLFDGSVSNGSISREIINCLKLAEGGLDVVVLVLSVRTRFTQEELNTLSTLLIIFGTEILDYLLVLFTGGDELEAESKTLNDYIHNSPDIFKSILSMCGDRTVMFDNMTTVKYNKAKQVEKFLDLVAKIQRRTHGIPFKGQMHREIKEETERFRQQQKDNKARNLGETEFAEKNKQLQMSYDNKMSQMEYTVKNKLKETYAAHEKMVSTLNENFTKAQKENIHMYDKNSSQQRNLTMVAVGLAVPPVLDIMFKAACGAGVISCSIL